MDEPSIASEMDNTFGKIQAYFDKRVRLANLHSEFSCDPKCLRPGCKSPQIQVAATIFDVIGVAALQNKSLSTTLAEGFVLGLLPVEGQDRIARASLKIRKPCPYLRNEMCSVYRVRPLACILFPESFFVDGTAREKSQRAHFRDYLCLRFDCRISREREQVIKNLTRMLQREIFLSDCRLFGCSPFFLDLRDLLLCFGEQAVWPGENPCARLQFDAPLTVQQFDNLFQRMCGGFDPFADIENKVSVFEDLAARQNLLEYLQDKRAIKRLLRRCHDPERLFRLVGGVFKAKRMSLIPSESGFL